MDPNTVTAALLLIGLAGFTIGFYFLPTTIAGLRKHKNTFMILSLNLVFGWTIIGWFALIIFACASQDRKA